MKKPKKSGSEYYKYKDFFSLMLLALVDAKCRFLLLGQVDPHQMHRFFTKASCKRRLRMAPWGFCDLNHCRGSRFSLLLAGWLHLCLDAMVGETLQWETTHKGRENRKLQDLKRQEGCGECGWNPDKQIQGVTGHNGAKAEGCQKKYISKKFQVSKLFPTKSRPLILWI